MKRIGIILMVLLSTVVVSAQRGDVGQRGEGKSHGPKMSSEERQEQQLVQMTKNLSLTPEQVADVTKIQDKLTLAIEVKRSTMSKDTDRKVMRKEMAELREQYNEDVKALLTDEQKVKYEAYLKEREDKMMQRQGQHQGQRQGGGQGSN
ncbi:MAG: hypothetical protein PF444_00130 [Bacteroidales bacterium]|nr:hypothetical protein [Bacteroidales bacterium]